MAFAKAEFKVYQSQEEIEINQLKQSIKFLQEQVSHYNLEEVDRRVKLMELQIDKMNKDLNDIAIIVERLANRNIITVEE